MKHKLAREKLEEIFNTYYLPEVCERFFINPKKLHVRLVENDQYHMRITNGMPCVIELNIKLPVDDVNTHLRNALNQIRKHRLDQPFPLVPKSYYKDSKNSKWRIEKEPRHTGQQSLMVDVLPKSDIEYEQVIVTRVKDKVTGLIVETKETRTDIKDMPKALWIQLTENVRDYEIDREKTAEIETVITTDTPELDKAILETTTVNNNATN